MQPVQRHPNITKCQRSTDRAMLDSGGPLHEPTRPHQFLKSYCRPIECVARDRAVLYLMTNPRSEVRDELLEREDFTGGRNGKSLERDHASIDFSSCKLLVLWNGWLNFVELHTSLSENGCRLKGIRQCCWQCRLEHRLQIRSRRCFRRVTLDLSACRIEQC